MTLRITDVVALKSACENLKQQKTSVKTAYKLSKILNAVQKEFEFFQSKFQELIQEYAEKDENGQPIILENGNSVKIAPSRLTEAQQKIDELSNLEVELDISLISLNELEGLEISISDMQQLACIIDEN